MISLAVIMAAGRGTRFGHRTDIIPKGFIPFHGIPMIERSVNNLIKAGIDEIIIGTGYHAEHFSRLADRHHQIKTVFSPRFAETNSMETLFQCRNTIGNRPFLLLESDIVYEQKALTTLLESPDPDIMLISPLTKFQDQYYVETDRHGFLKNCSTIQTELTPQGELVGIHKISPDFFTEMTRQYQLTANNEPKLGYEFQILRTATSGNPMKVLSLPGLQWYEIDDEADLRFAEENITIL